MSRAAVLFLIFITCACLSGCTGRLQTKQTGFAYLFDQAQKMQPGCQDDILISVEKSKEIKDTGKVIPQQGRKVYLTFDDGPDRINTPLVLDILDGYNVKATFFVVGKNIQQNPGLLTEIVNRGHALGNHTYHHRFSDVYATGSFMESVKVNEELIFQLVGQRPNLVRAPGGGLENWEALQKVLAQNGCRLVFWDIDSYDSRKPYADGAEIIENIRRQAVKLNLYPGLIVLMHDGNGRLNSVRALPTVLEMLLNQGFQFETLPKDF